jgi:octaprenyl-diphosphate synthase
MDAMHETGALEYARHQAERAADQAREAANVLQHSKYRDCLLELATFAVTRNY